jgi:hypothetical protein
VPGRRLALVRRSVAGLLALAGVLAGGTARPQDRGVPVYVRVVLVDSTPRVGTPLRRRITLQNRLSLALHWSTYSLAPNPGNGETLNVNLLESHRVGTDAGLFVAAPRIEPPRPIARPSSHTVPPGGDLAVTVDLQKWRIVEGWRAGDYRVVLELLNVGVDNGRVRLAVASETLAFTIAP